MTAGDGMVLVDGVDELADLLGALGAPAFIRFSAGPDADADHPSEDGETGIPLPGLSVNTLDPEPWWDRPAREWLARRVCQYAHLADDERFAWVLTGRVVGRGPDNEPLVVDVVPVARLGGRLLDEARRIYRTSLRPGRLPTEG